jgi:signal transduction histidine kinase
MGLHRRSIRLRIFLLVLIPLLSLLGLYIFAASITIGQALGESHSRSLKTDTGEPVGNFEAQAYAERRLAMIYAAAPAPQFLTQLDTQEAKTDQTRSAMTAALNSNTTQRDATVPEKAAIAALVKSAAGLNNVRAAIAQRSIGRPQVLAAYNGVIDASVTVLKQIILSEPDVLLAEQGLALVKMGDVENLLMQEDAVLESDMVTQSFPAADRRLFTELVGARRAMLASALPDLNANDRYFYDKNIDPQISSALNSIEDTVVSDTHTAGPPPVQPASWGADIAAISNGFNVAGHQAADDLTARAQPVARSIYLRLALAGGLGLLALIASVLLSLFIGRGLVRQLASLRASALTLATERLPRVVARLRAGEEVDVSAEAPPIETSPDEIGQVGQAFNTAARTAVEAAVEQAKLRNGISDVFRNLARRSQSLLHRQLTLLDTMERRATDPDELGDLYRLDHLTTRMRRHAEGLIILSGAAPGRAWRNPVRLVDVLRAAVAEVEDYTRVTVVTMTQSALAGPVVADVIHMIAELVENATIFSPPNTPVRLTGDMVARGFAVEIEDRGLGMNEEKLAEINERLASPPEFDLSDSDQLGLFVAGRLAIRHNIKISMRLNPYGGTTAIVLIPRDLVVAEELFGRDPSAALPGGDSSVQPTGRHASRSEDIIAVATPMGAHPYATNGLRTDFAAGIEGPETGPGEDWDVPSPFSSNTVASLPEVPPAAPSTSVPSSDSWFHRPGDNGWPQREEPAAVEAVDPAASTADLTELGLPRRVRQANLAPQLRGAEPQNTTGVENEPGFRSPEEARATMTAIQQGWERGRSASGGSESEFGEPTDGEPDRRAPMDGDEE